MLLNQYTYSLPSLPPVVSGSRDSTLRVWNIESGECTQTLLGHVAAVRWLAHNVCTKSVLLSSPCVCVVFSLMVTV